MTLSGRKKSGTPWAELAAPWGGSLAQRSVLARRRKLLSTSTARAIWRHPESGGAPAGTGSSPIAAPSLRHVHLRTLPGEEGGGSPSAYVMAGGVARRKAVDCRDNALWHDAGTTAISGFQRSAAARPWRSQAWLFCLTFHLTMQVALRLRLRAVLRVLQALTFTSSRRPVSHSVCVVSTRTAPTTSATMEIEQVSKDVRKWEKAEQARNRRHIRVTLLRASV